MRVHRICVDGALCIMHGLLTGIGIKWIHVAGRAYEMHWCFLITTKVIEIFWIISWAEVDEIAKSYTGVAKFYI